MSRNDITVAILAGPAQAVNVLRRGRGSSTAEIIGALIRRAEEVTRRPNGKYYVMHRVELDAETGELLHEADERLGRALSALTWNRLPNIGACMLWDRMGRKIDAESITEAKRWLRI